MPTKTHTEPVPRMYLGLLAEDGVDEIVTSVLDAADVEILEDLGEGPAGAAGPDGVAARAAAERALLVRELLADILWRYFERQRRQAGVGP